MLHWDDPTWTRYEAHPVAIENGSVSTAVNDPDVACLSDAYRTCGLERYTHEHGGVVVNNTLLVENRVHGYDYVFLGSDGAFETDHVESGETARLTLEPVSAEEMLLGASTPVDRGPPVVGAVISDGSATTREHHDLSGLLFSTGDGEVYTLSAVASASAGGPLSGAFGRYLELGLTALLAAAGLGLVLRGQRIRVTG
ncbi:MAG: hypothetical protein ABEJ42_10085 [Halobacteriaceae archaeon]